MSFRAQNVSFDKFFPNYDNNCALPGHIMKQKDILQSWKDIAKYMNREIRTCIRWERELGLPVHRFDEESSRSKVFAYKSEIEEWLKSRGNNHNHVAPSIWDKKVLVIGLMSVLILASFFLGYFYFFFRGTSGSQESEPTLAVLPFENLNTSEYEEYFSEGLTKEITNSLIRLNRIKVVPSASDNEYENTPENLSKISKDLRADYFLLGKIEKGTGDIKVIISLIRGKDRENIWTEEYQSDLEDIFSIEDDICLKIHERLNIDLDEGSLLQAGRGSTRNYGAYDAYLKGDFILNRLLNQSDDPWKLYHQGKYYLGKFTPESNDLAIRFFNQAIEIDKHYALPYIGLALCYGHNVNFQWDSDIEWLKKAERLLGDAQKITPDLPEYFSALIEINLLKENCFGEDNLKTTLDLAEEAVEKYPENPQLNSITGFCYWLRYGEKGDEGDFEKALEYKGRSFLLDPSGANNIKLAELLMLKGEFYDALEVCHAIEKNGPSIYSRAMQAEIYYYSGDLDKSREIFLQLDFPLNFEIYSRYFLAMIAAQKGEIEEAVRLVQRIETMKPEEFRLYEDELKLASIYIGSQNREIGYQKLESFFNDEHIQKEKFIKLKYIEKDRNFDSIRTEERFQKIIKGD
jgi:TolB-like protein/tetratricopeptide (TPR) repeat protein